MRIRAFAPAEAVKFAKTFDTLGSGPRLLLFTLIAQYGAARPIELEADLREVGVKLSQPTVSHHLRKLLAAGLVSSTTAGIATTYRLTEYGHRVHTAVRGVR